MRTVLLAKTALPNVPDVNLALSYKDITVKALATQDTLITMVPVLSVTTLLVSNVLIAQPSVPDARVSPQRDS